MDARVLIVAFVVFAGGASAFAANPGESGSTAAAPAAPIIITRPDGDVDVDDQRAGAIEDTIGRDQTPGASEQFRCPGGQVLTQAQGDVKNPDCR